MCFFELVVANVSDEEMQEHYDNFFEDVFVECEDKYGEIEEMNVCDNLGDHLVGNVYIKVFPTLTKCKPTPKKKFHFSNFKTPFFAWKSVKILFKSTLQK